MKQLNGQRRAIVRLGQYDSQYSGSFYSMSGHSNMGKVKHMNDHTPGDGRAFAVLTATALRVPKAAYHTQHRWDLLRTKAI